MRGNGVPLREGKGAFVTSANGIAGYLSGKANVAAGPIAAGGQVLLRVNTTGAAVDQTIDVGPRSIHVVFTATEGNVFEVSISNLTLNIADFVTIEGDITFGNRTLADGTAAKVFAGENLSIFLGQGPSRLANGALNPLATGVLLSNGRIGLIQIGSTYALSASGTVSLVGISGVTIGGTVTVQVNTTGKKIDHESLAIPGSTAEPVEVDFQTGAIVKRFQVLGAQVSVLGVSFSADLAFEQAGGDLGVVATNVAMTLGPATLSNGTAALLLTPAGLATRLSGAVQVSAPGAQFGGTFGIAINTTTAAVDRTFTLGGAQVALKLAAGPSVRVEGTAITITIAGQTLSGNVAIEQAAGVTTVAASNVAFTLSAGTAPVLRLAGG